MNLKYQIFLGKIFCQEIVYLNYEVKDKVIDYFHYLIANKIYIKNNNNKYLKFPKYYYLGNLKFSNINSKIILPSKKKSNIITFVSCHKEELKDHLQIIKFCPGNCFHN